MRLSSLLTISALISLGACTIYKPTPNPDYTIRVMSSGTGYVAVPPNCASWTSDNANPYDQQPLPQFGCAHARNLALMADKPSDLINAKPMGDTSGTIMLGAMRRYEANQTRGLIWTGVESNVQAASTSSAPASSKSGDAPIPTTSSSTTTP